MEILATVNWLAVVVATVVVFVAGGLWYGPLFGKPWKAMMGMKPDQKMDNELPSMAKGVANGFMAMTMMAILLGMMGPIDMAGALTLAFIGWAGFTLYSELGGVIWGNGNYPCKLMMINAGHQLMAALVGMAVLMYMG